MPMTLESFDCDRNPASVSVRWEKWKRALNIFLLASNVKKSAKKRACLLHIGGLNLQEVFYHIPGANVDETAQLKIVAWISSWISYVESMLIGDELCVEIAGKQRGNSVESIPIPRGQFIDSTRKDHRFHVDFYQFIHEDFLRRSTMIFWSSKK
uniref:Uncharacterized protein n=1 Tax=Trichogramma kaykai TaxID=54128 RepID=A0ABD2WDC1_9HYME